MSRWSVLSNQLYSGGKSIDIVGRRKYWYIISGVLLVVTIASLLISGLNLGIEFKGGVDFVFPAKGISIEQGRKAASDAGVQGAIVTKIGQDRMSIQTPTMTPEKTISTTKSLSSSLGVPVADFNIQAVGASWGGDVTKHALQALIVFLVLVFAFVSFYFQWRMAIAALIALAHDYSLFHIEVTPATVVGVLTILGYSLYDTVVVFDKVRENTKDIDKQARYTYGDAANLAVNQTLVRSINTSLVALLPVGAILFVGVGILQAGTLKDLALALFVGIAVGTYSSIFVATPILVQLEQSDPKVKALNARVASRRGNAEARVTNDGLADNMTAQEVADSSGGVAVATGPRSQPRRNRPRSKR
jgi:preprotein translocase subunit SecF